MRRGKFFAHFIQEGPGQRLAQEGTGLESVIWIFVIVVYCVLRVRLDKLLTRRFHLPSVSRSKDLNTIASHLLVQLIVLHIVAHQLGDGRVLIDGLGIAKMHECQDNHNNTKHLLPHKINDCKENKTQNTLIVVRHKLLTVAMLVLFAASTRTRVVPSYLFVCAFEGFDLAPALPC